MQKIIWEGEVDIILLPSSTLCNNSTYQTSKASPTWHQNLSMDSSRWTLSHCRLLYGAKNSLTKLLIGMLSHSPSHRATHEAQKLTVFLQSFFHTGCLTDPRILQIYWETLLRQSHLLTGFTSHASSYFWVYKIAYSLSALEHFIGTSDSICQNPNSQLCLFSFPQHSKKQTVSCSYSCGKYTTIH